MIRFTSGWLLPLVLLCSCGGGDNAGGTCTSNSQCKRGFLCSQDGACVPAPPLEIKTSQLETAVEGETYAQALSGLGGITPYTWSASFSVGWLAIDPVNGVVSSSGPVPTDAPAGIDVEVVLRDKSDGGEGMEVTRNYRLDVIECREQGWEYREVDRVCWWGYRDCVDGRYEDWTADERSSDVDHCGPGCMACDPEMADACVDGRCQCGNAGVCVNTSCCNGDCVDLMNDVLNCGACGHDCNGQLVHADGKRCEAGVCTYYACSDGWHDCDGDTLNGCETERDIVNCSACGDDCSDQGSYPQTEHPSCEHDEDLGIHRCHFDCKAYFDDCDGDYTTGCEQSLTEDHNCGACGHDCDVVSAGHRCIEDNGDIRCGCTTEAHCPSNRMCCSGRCVLHTDDQCTGCDTPCTIGEGGPYCVEEETGVWECQCDFHEDCRGDYSFSRAECPPAIDRCQCGSAETNCEGTIESMCCWVDVHKECVDLNTHEQNCGMCGAICAPGETCNQGACTCDEPDDCPQVSGASYCMDHGCGCAPYGGPACPVGQYCCYVTGSGNAMGCCLLDCDTTVSEGNSCSRYCGDPKVWCQSGCCDSCDPDINCE